MISVDIFRCCDLLNVLGEAQRYYVAPKTSGTRTPAMRFERLESEKLYSQTGCSLRRSREHTTNVYEIICCDECCE